ncbi:MAG: DUF3311 domain-containing protein [Thaumarchaeota archaeon]|nr:MAG: DUF3311 domain-containing protein [Nitrososphaerota archaeon]TLX82940.1 MAG: DUF3311 domain-containing protein [Nitrososphaerota archaeon]
MKIQVRHIILALFILIPSAVNLYVPLYNRDTPELFGLPFFYWFQTIWLVGCSGFYLAFAHLMNRSTQSDRAR